jgi:hypothetical protein
MTDEGLSTETRARLWGLAAAAVGLIVGIVVGQFEREVIAEAAGWSATIVLGMAYVFRRDRKQRWFWSFIGAVIIVHVALLCTAPWPTHHEMNKGDILFGVLDFFLMLAIGSLVRKIAGASDDSRSET